jgi:hypothetical protein
MSVRTRRCGSATDQAAQCTGHEVACDESERKTGVQNPERPSLPAAVALGSVGDELDTLSWLSAIHDGRRLCSRTAWWEVQFNECCSDEQ